MARVENTIQKKLSLTHGKYLILAPGASFQRVIESPKLRDSDLRLYLSRQLESYIPGKQEEFSFDFLSMESAGKQLNLTSVIRKAYLKEFFKSKGLKLIPSLLFLVQNNGSRDGLFMVHGTNILDYCYLKGGKIQLAGTMLSPIKEKVLKDLLSRIEDIDSSANGQKKSDSVSRNLYYWHFPGPEVFSSDSSHAIQNVFYTYTLDKFQLHSNFKAISTNQATNQILHNQLVKKAWFSQKSEKKTMLKPGVAILGSLFLLAASISTMRLIEVNAWKEYEQELSQRVDQLDRSVNQNLTSSTSNTIIDLRSELPVKFSTFMSIIRRSLSSGDYITQLDFRNGDFVIDFVGRNPFSKRDFLAEQKGFSDLQVSQITNINEDIRERFSIRGTYNYEAQGIKDENDN